MSGTGRGRGEGSKIVKEVESEKLRSRQMDVESSSSSESGDEAAGSERVVRGRGNYRTAELNTIPPNIVALRSTDPTKYRELKALANFVEVTPMSKRVIYQYRVEFNPNVESTQLRRRAFTSATQGVFQQGVTFDGMYDARSSSQLTDGLLTKTVELPGQSISQIEVKVKQVGTVPWQSFEMLRLYNTNMKVFLRSLGFFQVSQAGAYVHSDLRTSLNEFRDIFMIRGFRTAVNVHEQDKILMNLEPVHKLMQANNVLELMLRLRGQPNFRDAIKTALIGKLCVTNYNKAVYRIEDVNFDMNPASTFRDDRKNVDVSYSNYVQERYDKAIADMAQPLLLVVPNNRRKAEENDKDIYLVPELCNLAGLTDEQRNDSRLKFTLIQTSQVAPRDRVTQMRQFLNKFHSNSEVTEKLKKWGYTYGQEPVEIIAKQLPPEPVAIGRNANNPDKKAWPKIDQNASFDFALVRDSSLAVTPQIPRMAIFIAKPDLKDQNQILNELRKGFTKIGLAPASVNTIQIPEGDSPHHYVTKLRQLDDGVTCSIVILSRQNKERYDAIKKLCSVERGTITQVVTANLMRNERKVGGAAVKIGVQVAAKVGGEPWFVDLPLKNAMICGYDTYHDTAKRGRSFGAFVATTNAKFSRWFSRADPHDRLDELSAQVASNMQAALQRYKQLNGTYPDRVFLYRDGVSEGQIDHVFNVEMRNLKQELTQVNPATKFTMIIVNKRVGARFYARQGDSFANLPPGTIVDDIVTRKERYDFYLVSQATRAGTVTPTYYNIIHDESGLAPHIHQAMAYKLSMLYYNWTGTVRVPAPCQYAHKLALLCGEHLHAQPSIKLQDKLHFL